MRRNHELYAGNPGKGIKIFACSSRSASGLLKPAALALRRPLYDLASNPMYSSGIADLTTCWGEAMSSNLPDRMDAAFDRAEAPPDPLDRPEYYEGLLWRRSLAFCVDAAMMVAAIIVLWFLNFLTFFILMGVILFLWAAPLFIAYDTVTIGSNASATLGMRLLGLQTRSWDGQRPGYLQALISSCLFWFLVPFTGGLILIVAPFSDRRRHVHDMLSGTVVINTSNEKAPQITGP